MAKNALVLGGGGVLGIAWEIGVLKGLQEAGMDVTDADLIVGTSAGSVVGSRIACGVPVEDLVAEQYEPADGMIEENMKEIDLANVMTVFARWAAYPSVDQKACAEIGAMALASKTADEARYLAWFRETVGEEWPERDLRVTAVDAVTGEFRAWTRADGIPLADAVASSCAVPAIFPCVTINGRRYQDGGVRSGTSADLASGYDNLLIIAPIGSADNGIDPLLGRITRAEAEALTAAGSRVNLLYPDERTLQVFGINRMDTSRRGDAVQAGIAQAQELAGRLQPAWTTAAA